MSKYYIEEYEGNWEVWSKAEDDEFDALIATVYDEDFALQIVTLLNDSDPDEDDEDFNDDDFGEEVDEFIEKNMEGTWEEDGYSS